jgi:Ca2+ transporting ATPase
MIVTSIALSSDSQPLNTVEMLWINILMDSFAALALATEPPNAALLEERPYSRYEKIITPFMWRNIIGQIIYQCTIFFVFLFKGAYILGLTIYDYEKAVYVDGVPTIGKAEHYTFLFNLYVMM